ncbi:MAG: hypothetical protein WKF57_21775 [Nakamurella sp.]
MMLGSATPEPDGVADPLLDGAEEDPEDSLLDSVLDSMLDSVLDSMLDSVLDALIDSEVDGAMLLAVSAADVVGAGALLLAPGVASLPHAVSTRAIAAVPARAATRSRRKPLRSRRTVITILFDSVHPLR